MNSFEILAHVNLIILHNPCTFSMLQTSGFTTSQMWYIRFRSSNWEGHWRTLTSLKPVSDDIWLVTRCFIMLRVIKKMSRKRSPHHYITFTSLNPWKRQVESMGSCCWYKILTLTSVLVRDSWRCFFSLHLFSFWWVCGLRFLLRYCSPTP